MNRAVSSILIPLLLMSQSLFSVPHTHAGSSIADADGHAARPHVHLHEGGHHHGPHEDGDESPSSTGEPVRDHESDAFYCGDHQLLHNGKVATVANAELTALYVSSDEPSATAALCRLYSQLTSPPLQRPKCDLYLQLNALLC